MQAHKLPDALKELAESMPLTLTKEQLAGLLHVTEDTLERAVRRRQLRVIKGPGRGGRVVIPRCEALRFMTERLR